MYELAIRILASLLRLALAGVSTWLIDRGVITADENSSLLLGLAGVFITVLWAVWAKYKDHITFLTAAAMPPSSPAEVKAMVKLSPASLPPSNQVTPRLPMVVLALLGAGALTLSACAHPVPSVPPLPTAVDVSVRDAAMTALGLSQALGKLAVDVAKAERPLAQDQLVPANLHEAFRQRANGLADALLKFNDQAARAVTTYAELKAKLDPIIAEINGLIDVINTFGTRAKSVLSGAVDVLQGIAELFVSQLGAFGGGRDLELVGGVR